MVGALKATQEKTEAGLLLISNERAMAACAKVEETARGRHRQGNLPTLADEINFLMGAGAMLSSLGGSPGQLPVSWTFGLMGGESACSIEYERAATVRRKTKRTSGQKLEEIKNQVHGLKPRDIYRLIRWLEECIDRTAFEKGGPLYRVQEGENR